MLDQILKDINPELFWLKDHIIFLTISGSRAYNLDNPDSDTDLRGINTVPSKYLFGFNKSYDEFIKKEPDTTIFNIKKFFKLTSTGNPNTLELLFTEPSEHIIVTDLGKIIIENRNQFLSKLLKERYIGYAKSQSYRIVQHRKWLLRPLETKPTRESLGLPAKPLIEKNQFDCIKSLINKKLESWNPDFEPFSDSQKIYLQGKVVDILAEIEITSEDKWCAAARTIGIDENFILAIKKEKEFENKIEEWNNYQNWKKNRNPKRAILEAKTGYDCKHATQLVRLLKQGKEILETGHLQVKRTHDREELMAIKNGHVKYEQIIEYSDKTELEVKEAYKNSKLPNQPNINYLDNLCMELVQKNLEKHG